MLPTNSVGPALPVRTGADAAASPQAQTSFAVSIGPGDGRPSIQPETAQAVDPPVQKTGPQPLPRDDSNDANRLLEPSRLSAESIARIAETPTADTPVGPPPAFDFTFLEKARAIEESPSALDRGES